MKEDRNDQRPPPPLSRFAADRRGERKRLFLGCKSSHKFANASPCFSSHDCLFEFAMLICKVYNYLTLHDLNLRYCVNFS